MKQKKLIFAFSVIILVGVYYIWGMGNVYSWALTNKEPEQTQLLDQIAEVRAETEQVSYPEVNVPELEAQLEQIKQELDDERNAIPSDINGNEIIETIITLADESEVELCPIKTQRWIVQNMDMHGYNVFQVYITAEGSLLGLGAFLYKLEHSEFDSLFLNRVDLTLVKTEEESEEEEEESEEEDLYETYIANISLYAYKQGPQPD